MEHEKQLYRSRTQKVLGGVAGGLAEYFNIDVILMRLLFVAIVLAGGSGILLYIILWIVVPLEPYDHMEKKLEHINTYGGNNGKNVNEEKSNNRTFIVGVSLILLGVIFLMNTFFPYFFRRDIWPLVLIFAGVVILISETSKAKKEEPVITAGEVKKEDEASNEIKNNTNDLK